MSQWVYKDMNKSGVALRKVASVWTKKLNVIHTPTSCAEHFKAIRLITTVVKLRSFQYRLLHNKIFCNDILVHWGKSNNNVCNLCGLSKQTILHLMYDCPKVRPIWSKLQALMRKHKVECEFSLDKIIFNEVHENRTHVTNTIALIVKQFIFRHKCTGEQFKFEDVVREIKTYYYIELYNARIVDKVKGIYKRWSPVYKIFKFNPTI